MVAIEYVDDVKQFFEINRSILKVYPVAARLRAFTDDTIDPYWKRDLKKYETGLTLSINIRL